MEEIKLVRGGRDRRARPAPIFCYSKQNRQPKSAAGDGGGYGAENTQNDHGWCHTKGNYYDINREDENAKGWGWCGNECYVGEDEKDSGVIREKRNVQILDDKKCDVYLDKAISGQPVEVGKER